MATKWVYEFSEGSKDMRELLGGKGANVAEMTRILGTERVPGGFTITTEACVAYMREDGFPDGLDDQIDEALGALEERAGKKLGDAEDPLLVSVRSGARESMPGMLDTVLNLGLNDDSVQGLATKTENERFAWDSYRRFVQMFGNVVHGIEGKRFEDEIKRVKSDRGVKDDTELDVEALQELTHSFKELYEFPIEPREQLEQAIRAVFDSWNGERAATYRRINRIPDDWGTAVNVQQMVFGNKGDDSGSGVAFSRDEVTGAPEPSGDFLINAQGEDVVSGVRNTLDISDLDRVLPEVHKQLMEILRELERHYGDMQDTEFTVEEGQLYMLQTRNAKRPAQAAVRFAVDAVGEGLLDKAQAMQTIDPETLDALLHPTFDPQAEYDVLASGVAASPGAAVGEIVFTAAAAVQAAADGRDVILARPFTEADDVAGFHAAKGIVTSEGGKASHAALVARGMGVPAVTGASDLEIDVSAGEVRIDGTTLHAGDRLAIDGTTGSITTDDVPLVEPGVGDAFDTVLKWADELRTLRVRANADTPEDARKAREFGAEGIGLCRTEHMFFGEDRHEKMVQVILADEVEERRKRLDELAPLQQGDFEGLFEAMEGLPVTIRLLDPPLHEFLPDPDDLPEGPQQDRARSLAGGQPDARHARRAPRDPLSGDLRDAGPGDDARGQGGARPHRRDAPPRGHDPARRLRARARPHARRDRARRPRGGHGAPGRLHDRDDDRAAAGVLPGRPDRRGGRLLLLRDQRPHPDRAGLQPRRHRGQDPRPLHRAEDLRSLAVRDDRRAGRGADAAHGRVAGPQDQAGHQARRLRRARRRPRLDRLLPPLGYRLRVLQPVSRAGRPRRRRPGGRARRVELDGHAGHRLDLEQQVGQHESGHLDQRARRRALHVDELVADDADGGQAGHVDDEDRELHDVGPRGATGRQGVADVLEGQPGLRLPVAGRGRGPVGGDGDLPGGPHEAARRGQAHDVAVARGGGEGGRRCEFDRGHGFDSIGRPVAPSFDAEGDAAMPDLQFLEPASFGPSTLPFSQGVRAGNLLFIAGQGAVDDDGNLAGPGDIREQTRVTLDRVRRVCEEAGGDLSNVVTATVFLTDLANFGVYNEAWVEAFGDHRPARATVEAGLLFDMLVEVQAIAVVG